MLQIKFGNMLIATSALAVGCMAAGCEDKAATTDASAEGAKSGAAASGSAKAAAPKVERVASCNTRKSDSMCREYAEANIDAGGEEFIRGLCTEGEFKMEACPKDARVGVCKTQEGSKVFYSDGGLPLEASAAEKACKEGLPAGEWSAGS